MIEIAGATAAATLLSIFDDRLARTAGASAEAIVRMSLREMSDRLEIQQNLWDYCNAVDLQNWDALDEVFTPDASNIYGPSMPTLADAKAFLKASLPTNFSGYYHMMQNMWIAVDGDRAESYTRCLNPMTRLPKDGQVQTDFHLIWYHWTHVRIDGKWRISGRAQAQNGPKGIHWSAPPAPAGRHGPPYANPAAASTRP
ncbi:MAG TPA: nuclear transport factor 2 family protein [Alphaproteobacteria bacterium]|nr:nuclear transport factor 2 family protein [Alphaproteobacteria bacterium]